MPQPMGLSSDATRDDAESPKSLVFSDSKLTSSEPPDASTRSCIAVIGAFSIMFCSVGFINAFGVFQEYYAKNILANKSASDISWLGSFNVFCMLTMIETSTKKNCAAKLVPPTQFGIAMGSVMTFFSIASGLVGSPIL
ncbi:hypothetical protein BCON_0093g00160 [Botryotinia convoluta]|uniref:Major facilitator superfamily (MFS) profile domain-containing protein n=1 Tax=Botryotinia convoluta TaxID=54673 RepID=A0A4Z1I1W3_9HELO|nr:hypothetical protein BCON_0093g00160 [Botryotinia convoluta]